MSPCCAASASDCSSRSAPVSTNLATTLAECVAASSQASRTASRRCRKVVVEKTAANKIIGGSREPPLFDSGRLLLTGTCTNSDTPASGCCDTDWVCGEAIDLRQCKEELRYTAQHCRCRQYASAAHHQPVKCARQAQGSDRLSESAACCQFCSRTNSRCMPALQIKCMHKGE